MKVIKNMLKNLFPLIIIFGTSQVIAGDILNIEKVKLLVVGNTVEASHLKKGFEFKVYFDLDGVTAYRKQDGDIVKTTYKFEENKHCIYWKDKDRCANIVDNGDGTYNRVKSNGKSFVKWSKVVKGKVL